MPWYPPHPGIPYRAQMAAGEPTSLTTTMDRPKPGTVTWGATRRTAARNDVSAVFVSAVLVSAVLVSAGGETNTAESGPSGSARRTLALSAAVRFSPQVPA